MAIEQKKGILWVISGPSAAGKGTICAKLREDMDVGYSISATTRAPRGKEVHGKEYFFLTTEEFEAKIADGGFLEWAKVYDKYYGTPKDYVSGILDSGKDCILEIDVQGALNVKTAMPEAVLIFILPPSKKELRRRLENRATETPEQIDVRMSWAMGEVKQAEKYDYIVMNDDLQTAISDAKAIIEGERHRAWRNGQMVQKLLEDQQ